jgi:hypothetical protein
MLSVSATLPPNPPPTPCGSALSRRIVISCFGGAIGQVGDGDRVDAVHLQAALHEPRHLFTR